MSNPVTPSSQDPVSQQTQVDLMKEEQEWTEKHWTILEASIRVFSEKGFGASKTSEIAKEAGVSEGTIFNYFKTKKDLLVSLLIPLFVKFFRPMLLNSVEKIARNRKGKDIQTVLEEIAKDRITLGQNNLSLLKTVAAEAAFHPELLNPIREKVMPQVVQWGTDFIEKEVKKGVFREVDPLTTFRIFMSMIAGYVALRNIYPEIFGQETEDVEIQRMVDIILHGITADKRSGE